MTFRERTININTEINDFRDTLRSNLSGNHPKKLVDMPRMSDLERYFSALVNSPNLDLIIGYRKNNNGSSNSVEFPVNRTDNSTRILNTNARTGPVKSILKNSKIISSSNWNGFLDKAQNVDLDDVDVSRLSREIGRGAAALDTKVTNAVQPNPSHQAGDWKSERNDSLLENRPDFQRDLLTNESDLSEDVSKAAQKAEGDIVTDITNAETGIVDAADDLE